MSDYEKAVVSELRRNAKKLGVWSPGRDDMLAAADLIEELCGQRDAAIAAADVRDILRCKDCRYSDFQYQEKGKGEEATPVCVCYYLNRHVRADDYCSFVARTDGKGDTNAEVN